MNKIIGTSWVIALLASLGIVGCAEREAEPAAPRVTRPAIETQEIAHPCEWLLLAEVEEVIGKLPRAPHRGYGGETPRPDAEGNACLYPVAGSGGAEAEIAMRVDLFGAAEYESGMGMVGGMFARDLKGPGAEPTPAKRTDGWDFVDEMPGVAVWRVGHVAIQFSDSQMIVPFEKKQRLAEIIRDRLRDLPFAAPGDDATATASEPDPCELLTRAEAEAVLGKLLVEPYRFVENGAIAAAEGASCSFYTGGHRVLILTPTYLDGKMMFEMAGGIGGLIRSATGGANEGDLLDGPWDEATRGASGSLFFLKGDKMLEIRYQTSLADAEEAAILARAAIGRL